MRTAGFPSACLVASAMAVALCGSAVRDAANYQK
jgi:hypothetical protein